jgi:hypothetical protein
VWMLECGVCLCHIVAATVRQVGQHMLQLYVCVSCMSVCMCGVACCSALHAFRQCLSGVRANRQLDETVAWQMGLRS